MQESKFMGLCEDPDRAKELSVVAIVKTLKILLEKIDLLDNTNNASVSNGNDRN